MTPTSERSLLTGWADLMREDSGDLSLLLTTEQGKPLAESRTEIEYAASLLEWFGEKAKRIYGKHPRRPGFVAKIQPLLHTQNRVVVPTDSSPQ